MNEKHPTSVPDNTLDRKIDADWDAVRRRLEDVNSRSGGASRRQAILNGLRTVKRSP